MFRLTFLTLYCSSFGLSENLKWLHILGFAPKHLSHIHWIIGEEKLQNRKTIPTKSAIVSIFIEQSNKFNCICYEYFEVSAQWYHFQIRWWCELILHYYRRISQNHHQRQRSHHSAKRIIIWRKLIQKKLSQKWDCYGWTQWN